MTQEQVTLHLCEVIAQQKQKINQLESSNNYLREQKEDLTTGIIELNKSNTEKDLLITNLEDALKTCHETIDVKNDLILACDKLISEQKETIETLQSSVKSMDLEYKTLAAEYNALS